ncbi:Protein of unknown function [Thermobacillus xylanilyticus]|uniref:Uncharacterized protein n=1 Tax=Thermobacillus xylanilyticus TaxID=76633 RepID=A0ABM8V204_THEXY|nr:Protein of unknown function [Thermobacillus xylanilyticus]
MVSEIFIPRRHGLAA